MTILQRVIRTAATALATRRPTALATYQRSSAFSAWSLGRFNHVAIATPDLQKSISLYKDVMGAKVHICQPIQLLPRPTNMLE